MATGSDLADRDWVKPFLNPYHWIVVVVLVATTLLHYLSPQTRLLPAPAKAVLTRHTVERFLLMLPVIVEAYAYRWRAGALVLALVVLIMLPRAIWISPSPADALIETAVAAATGGLGIWAIEAQTREKILQEKAAAQLRALSIENARLYERMRFYARQVMHAQEEERERIARELHDETIQLLIVVSQRLDLLAALPEPLPADARQVLASVQELLRNTQQGLRRFAQGLRPPTLEHLGLVSAVRGLANELAEAEGIQSKLSVLGEARRLSPEKELTLFRIAQEALNNARRHAGASRADVRLEFHANRVRLTVADNGRGFDASARTDGLDPSGKLGLIGMDERAQGLGGTLSVESEPGRGTTILVEVPL